MSSDELRNNAIESEEESRDNTTRLTRFRKNKRIKLTDIEVEKGTSDVSVAPGCAPTRKRVTPMIVFAPKTKKSAQDFNPPPRDRLIKPADLEKAQRDLALSCSRKRCKSTYKGNSMAANSSSSSFNDEVVVVPHRIEGVFIAKGKNEDAICTKNLVPGEAVYGEELISVKNKDGTETEYRVWNPSRSKLAGAIQSGVNNIWVKPGSRVLYMGDVCGTTVSHLSDLVGPDGLVYALGLSDVVVNMAEKRSNVIAIYEQYFGKRKYRMFLSMVDVICADPTSPTRVKVVAMNVLHYLRAGGHFLISTQADGIVSTVQSEATFAELSSRQQREFKLLETIKLEQGLVMAVGCFRVLDA